MIAPSGAAVSGSFRIWRDTAQREIVSDRTEVFVRKVAPLGDPMEVTVRGYELSLRKADTEMIEVE